jgi:hypothetical protein
MPTHTHTQTQTHHKHITKPPAAHSLLQSVPQATQTFRHRLKIDGVTSIELKSEESLNKQSKRKINV